MDAVEFRVSARAGTSEKSAEAEFNALKAAHYKPLLARNIPGGAWFRHQLDTCKGSKPALDAREPRHRERGDSQQELFGLFSGGRAISENLQLDRNMLAQGPGLGGKPLL